MRKTLLLLVAAVMCCATNVWALSGAGTEAEPYVVADGETFSIPANQKVWFNFTAPANGTVDFLQSVTYLSHAFMVKDANGVWQTAANFDYNGTNTGTYALEEGRTYEFMTNVSAWSADEITVRFVAAAGDALDVVSANPAEGSDVASITEASPVQITFNKEVGYVMAEIQGGEEWSSFEAVMVTEGSETGEEAPATSATWNLVPYVDITLYEGIVYTVTLKAYATEEDWLQEGNPEATPAETTTITYNGASEAIQYSDVKLVSISPDPNVTELEDMLSVANPSFTVTFSGAVNVVSCTIALGSGGSIDVPTEGNGTATITCTPPVGSSDYSLAIVLQVTDTEGLLLNDENPAVDGVMFWNNSYSFDMPVADGRTADTSLEATDVVPADGGYVSSLEKVTFTMTGAGDQDGFYGRTSKANAGIYKDDVKVYDVLLTQDDERAAEEDPNYIAGTTGYFIATVCELNSVDYDNVEAAVPASITESGTYTLKIDEQSIGDGNFDPNAPWLGDLGGVQGRCNPEIAWTFNVVSEIVEVTNVDPAPYNTNGGVFNSEIPAEVKITMSSENFTVQGDATVRYGMNTMEIAQVSVEGNVLTVSGISEEARNAGQATVMVSAVSADGAPIVYGADAEEGLSLIILTYQTDRATLVPVSVDPAEGTVESLETITLLMSEYVGTIDMSQRVVVTDQAGTETVCSMDYDWSVMEAAIITLDEPITEEGIYTLVIPEGTIYSMDSNFGFVDEYGNPEGDYYNPELTYTFRIGNPDGIDSVAADENRVVKAYTVSGICVGEGTMAELKDLLPAGIYIMDGQKVAVVK